MALDGTTKEKRKKTCLQLLFKLFFFYLYLILNRYASFCSLSELLVLLRSRMIKYKWQPVG